MVECKQYSSDIHGKVDKKCEWSVVWSGIELFYLNSIEQLENLVGLKEQLEVCLTCSRLLAAIQMLLLHQKLRCDSNKTTLCIIMLKNGRILQKKPRFLNCT